MHITKDTTTMKRGFYNRKGSFTVEAVIFLPIFIIAILTCGYLIKLVAVQENVFHSFADEMHLLSAEAGGAAPNSLFFKHDLLSRIEEENGDELHSAKLNNFRYRTRAASFDEIIYGELDYEITNKLPIKMTDKMPVYEYMACRAFVGKNNAGTRMPFSELEQDKVNDMVWVFPRAGERYHKQHCGYIAVQPKEKRLDGGIRRKYDPCRLCNVKSAANGSLVYCFEKYGESYHSGNCTSVDRYVTEMSEDEAKKRGYSPCAKCGG